MSKGRYRSTRTEIGGYVFASKKEAERYMYLLSCEHEGVITSLIADKSQLRFVIAEGIRLPEHGMRPKRRKLSSVYYEADFRYNVTLNGEIYTVWEDVKAERKGKPYMDAKSVVKMNLFRILTSQRPVTVLRICISPTANPLEKDEYFY